MVATHSEEEWRLLTLACATRAAPTRGGWLEHVAARLQLPPRRHRGRARASASSSSSTRSSRARAEAAARYDELLAASTASSCRCADDADHVRSWFVYVVELPGRRRPRARDRRASSASADRLSRYLPSIHLQPYMRERYGFAEGLCPVAEDVARARSRCRSSRGSKRPRRSASPRFSARRCEPAEPRTTRSRSRRRTARRSVNCTTRAGAEPRRRRRSSPGRRRSATHHGRTEEIYFVTKGLGLARDRR